MPRLQHHHGDLRALPWRLPLHDLRAPRQLDGALARIKGTSGTWGAFLDSTMDRIADIGIFGGLVVWFYGGGHNPLLGGVRLFGLVTGSLVC